MIYQNITGLLAWELLQQEKNSFLVDIRTQGEWDSVGIPDLTNIKKDLIKIVWQADDPTFIPALEQAIPNKDSKIIFICRGGIRSAAAAEKGVQNGYKHCYNLTGGFEKGGWSSLPIKENN